MLIYASTRRTGSIKYKLIKVKQKYDMSRRREEAFLWSKIKGRR